MEIVNWFIDSILLVVHVFLSFAPPLVGLTDSRRRHGRRHAVGLWQNQQSGSE